MKKILVVEDDQFIAKIYKEKISSEGFDVHLVGTGAEALAYLAQNTPNLTILDVMLPGGMNGFDVLEDMKKNEEWKKIPVIMLTNLETEEKTSKEIGAVDYLVKVNTSISELVRRIRKILG